MAEKEEAGAPAEDDAVEAAPPADMMEACTLRWIRYCACHGELVALMKRAV
jgi:hypothetical protein